MRDRCPSRDARLAQAVIGVDATVDQLHGLSASARRCGRPRAREHGDHRARRRRASSRRDPGEPNTTRTDYSTYTGNGRHWSGRVWADSPDSEAHVMATAPDTHKPVVGSRAFVAVGGALARGVPGDGSVGVDRGPADGRAGDVRAVDGAQAGVSVGYRTLVAEVSDSIHLRRFCRISLSERVPDESIAAAAGEPPRGPAVALDQDAGSSQRATPAERERGAARKERRPPAGSGRSYKDPAH